MKRIVIIGYGGQGAWHAKQVLKDEHLELAGIFDVSEERKAAAKKEGIFVYDSFNDCLSDKTVDIAIIATPNDTHKYYALKCFENGKNVICEKPVALTVEDFDEMCECAEKFNKQFSVHQNRRWDIDFVAMKKIAESGEIGKLIHIESRIHGSRGIPSDWRSKKEYGGGMLYDWGVHLIDQILQFFPEKTLKLFCTFTHITNDEVDDGFKLDICFEGGKTAHIEVGTYNFIAMPRFYMQCRNGTAAISDWQQNARVSKLLTWSEKDVLPIQNAAGITKTMAPRDEITLKNYEVEKPVTDSHEFFNNFCNTIDGLEEPIIKNSEVRRVLQIVEGAFRSAKTGHVIAINV